MAQTVEELIKVLNSMRVKNEQNIKNVGKLLANINNKLESMSGNSDADDLVKVYLNELKNVLEERNSVAVNEYSKIEQSFKTLQDKQDKLADNAEMRKLFATMSNNFKIMLKGLHDQKDLLANYNDRLSHMDEDKSDKEDILKSVSLIRNDVDLINQGFEKSVSEINTNLQSIFKNLVSLDPAEQNELVKRELEKIRLATVSITKTINAVEEKNNNFERLFETFLTKDDYESSQKKLEFIIDNSNQVSEKLETLVTGEDLAQGLTQLNNSLANIKENLSTSKTDVTQFIDAHLDNLNSTLQSIVTDRDFANFRHELADFVQGILDNATLLGESLNVNKTSLEELINRIEVLDINKDISYISEVLDNLTKSAVENTENITDRIAELSRDVSNLKENIAQSDNREQIESLQNDVNAFKEEVSSQSVNVSNALHNLSKTEILNTTNIVEKIDELSQDVSLLKDNVSQNADSDQVANININVDLLKKTISSQHETVTEVLGNLTQSEAENTENLAGKLDVLAEDVSVLKENSLKSDNSQDIQAVNDNVEDLKAKLMSSQLSNETNIAEKSQDIIEKINTLTQSISVLRDKVVETYSGDEFQSVNQSVEVLKSALLAAQSATEVNMAGKTDNIASQIGELSVSLAELQAHVLNNDNSQEFATVNDILEELKATLLSSQATEINCNQKVDSILEQIETLTQNISTLQDNIENKYKNDEFQSVTKSLDVLKATLLDSQSEAESSLVEKADIITEQVQNLSVNIAELQANVLNNNNSGEFEAVNSSLETLKSILASSQVSMETAFSDKANDIYDKISELTQNIVVLKDSIISNNNSEQFDKVNDNIEFLKTALATSQSSAEFNLAEKSDRITATINELVQSVLNIKENIEQFDNRSDLQTINNGVEALKASLTSSQLLNETNINEKSEGITEKINELFNGLSELRELVSKNDNGEKLENLYNDVISFRDTLISSHASNGAILTEKTDNIIAKINELAQDIITLQDSVRAINNNDDQFDNINFNIDAIKDTIISSQFAVTSDVLAGLTRISDVNKENIIGKIEELSQNVSKLSDDILQTSDNDRFENLHNDLNSIKDTVISSQASNGMILTEQTDIITEQISDLKQEISTLNDNVAQSDNSERFEALHNDLNSVKDTVISSQASNGMILTEQTDIITEQIAGLKQDISTLNDNIEQNRNGEKLDDINENIDSLKDTILTSQISNSTVITEKTDNIITKIDTITENISILADSLDNDNSEQFADLHNDVISVKDTIISSQASNGMMLTEKTDIITGEINQLSENVSALTENISAINNDTKINDAQEDIKNSIISAQNSTETSLTEKSENIIEKINQLSENILTVNDNINQQNNTEKLDNIHNDVNYLKETVLSSQISNETNFTEKLLALRDMVNSGTSSNNDNFNQLKNQIDDFISNNQKITEDTEIKLANSISEIVDLKNEVENLIKEFSNWNDDQENRDSKLVNMISSSLQEIGTSIGVVHESVQSGVHQELTQTSDLIEAKINNLLEIIEDLKTQNENNEEEPPIDFEGLFKDVKDKITAVKQEINLVNTDIMDVLSSKAEAVVYELTQLKNSFGDLAIEQQIKDIINNSADTQAEIIENAVCEIRSLIDEKITQQQSFDGINEQIKSYADEVKNELSEKIVSGNEDLKKELNERLLENVEDIKSVIADNSVDNNIKDLVIDVTSAMDDLNLSISDKISMMLDELGQKVDNLANSDDNDDKLLDEIDEIKSAISSQKSLIEKSTDNERIDTVANRLEELIEKINNIETSDLKDIKESILTAILNVFEQISFIEESEDIKDFVEERTDEINQNLTDVKYQLEKIANLDSGYSYSLQDVESDIAKLRIVLNDISNKSSEEELSDISENIHRIVSTVEGLQSSLTQEQVSDLKNNFEKLSEDVLSISSRTNKLLLTSDESYNALNNGLNDFSKVICQLEERINYLDNKEITVRIENKLDHAISVINEGTNSDKVMRQALMYVGEWIDSASEKLSSLCEQSQTVNEVHSIIENLQENVPEQKELLDTLANKFDEQQERMDRLEMKLEKVLSAIDDLDDTKLTRKVDKIDKQLAKLTENIEKLTSYVDE